MSRVFDVDRGGKWRHVPGALESVSRRDGQIGADFVNFLDIYEASGGNIRWDAASFMLQKRYTEQQCKFFVNLLDMYIHTVLRKLPKDEQED